MRTVSEAVDAFLIAKQADGLAEATVAWYRYMLARFERRFSGMRLERLTPQMLRLYVLELRKAGLSLETQRSHVRAMKTMLNWAWDECELSGRCPASRIRKPPSRLALPRAIDLSDVRALLNVCDDTPQGVRNRAIVLFLIDTGCRAAGLVRLTPDDVDLARRVARLREKGDHERLVVFTLPTANAVSEWLSQRPNDAQTLFCAMRYGRCSGALTVNGLRLLLNRLKRKAGIKGRVNPHAFRHAFARAYLSNGGDLATLSQLLGHKDISSTAIYTQYVAEELAVLHGRYSPISLILEGKNE